MTIYGVDFGAGDALAIHGPNGPISKRQLQLPRVKGGRTPALEFIMVLEALMLGNGQDTTHAAKATEDPKDTNHTAKVTSDSLIIPGGSVVVESATIGASGCEVEHVQELVARAPAGRHLYTISCRAVKNYRADHQLNWRKGARYVRDGDPAPQTMTIEEQAEVHVEDAEIIYKIATTQPERLYRWTEPSNGLDRCYTSVRPMDKRGYRDARAEAFMQMAPAYADLPDELRETLGNGKDYSRSMVMPFIMASDEPYLDEGPLDKRRRRYEKIIGLYDRGYPSFYRRATITWMQANAKRLAGTTKIAEVSPAVRKQAWSLTQRQIRQFFHLLMQAQGR